MRGRVCADDKESVIVQMLTLAQERSKRDPKCLCPIAKREENKRVKENKQICLCELVLGWLLLDPEGLESHVS